MLAYPTAAQCRLREASVATIGVDQGSSVSMTDGSLTVGSSELLGSSGNGTFTQTGGTHTVAAELYVGAGGNGSYALSARHHP